MPESQILRLRTKQVTIPISSLLYTKIPMVGHEKKYIFYTTTHCKKKYLEPFRKHVSTLDSVFYNSEATWDNVTLTQKLLFENIRLTFKFSGGVPTSLVRSGQQWDLPNGWPCLEDILVQGLLRLHTPAAKQKAYEIAMKWLESNYKGFTTFGKMFEKVK